MTPTPAMDEDMWWITGDFMMLSNFLASRMPEFMVKSSRTKATRMTANPIRKWGKRTQTRTILGNNFL